MVAQHSPFTLSCAETVNFKRRRFYLEAKRPQFGGRVFTGNLRALGSFSPGDFQQPLANQRMLVVANRGNTNISSAHTVHKYEVMS